MVHLVSTKNTFRRSLWRWHGYKLDTIPIVTPQSEQWWKLTGASDGWRKDAMTMPNNEITTLDAAMTILLRVARGLHPVSGSLADISP
jgi:hypothetical protein